MGESTGGWRVCGKGRGRTPAPPGPRAGRPRPQGFTLVEVMVAMTVLLMLVMGMTRMFSQASALTKQGLTSVARNGVAETAMETMLQDVDGMIVNERLGCYIESDSVDYGSHGFGFDEVFFVSTSGDQDDDMPYEYFHYYVKEENATNSLGAKYTRFDLHKARMIMAVGDKNNTYALAQGKSDWWETLSNYSGSWDDQVLAENVVRFDLYCQGWDGSDWMSNDEFYSHKNHPCGNKLGELSDVAPAAFDIYLQVTSPDAAMEGGMALASGAGGNLEVKGRELMYKESASYFGRAVPMTGVSQLYQQSHGKDQRMDLEHYVD